VLNPRILTINCGSSSLKFALLEGESFLAEGLFEQLGTAEASGRWKINGQTATGDFADADHAHALAEATAILGKHFETPLRVDAVGHRVVHGGEFFREATVVNDDVLAKIESCSQLAPLHNPANILGIRVAQNLFPDVPHVAVFDTAFHQTMPERAWLYAVPFELYERHAVRRYGFHGTSHEYVANQAAMRLGRSLESFQIITAHLGNGCSACAVHEGKSADTTMGLTPLEGLVMGTRSGDVDPDLPQYLRRVAGMSPDEVAEVLNRRSGLLGVSGVSNDMRGVLQAAVDGNERAKIAVDLFCYRLAKAVLGLSASLERIDALIFTGGIGENSAPVRERTLSFLKMLRAEIDPDLNAVHGGDAHPLGRITRENSGLLALVVPTNEERAIAERTAAFLQTS
jgi:acetate kinase